MRYPNYVVSIILLFFFSKAGAQLISTSGTFTPQQLVENMLVDGCVEVSNISSPLNGTNIGITSFGSFEKAGSTFPFENGIVLSSGSVQQAGNTVISTNLNQGNASWGGDTDLQNALGVSNTLNATVLEFDFTTANNALSFDYILASEEYYNENPCNHSDYFVVLLKPADNSAPYTNLATVPGTGSYVSTGTIHDQIVGFCDAMNPAYFQGYNVGDTNYNGRTTVLTASASIVPNTLYHIKMVISDQGDHNLDSSVFIKGTSFNSDLNLGTDVSTCENSYTIQSGFSSNNSTFQWYHNNSLLPGNQPSVTVTESGDYTLVAQVPFGSTSCTFQDTINITLNELLDVTPITNLTACDGVTIDGITTFNLSLKNTEAINSVQETGNYTVSYFLTESDATNNTNPISTQFTNSINPQPVYVRIDDAATGCHAVNHFNVTTAAPPTVPAYGTYGICDYDSNGTETFNLVTVKNYYLNLYPGSNVKLFETIENAEANQAPVVNSYTNMENPQTLYIRVGGIASCPAYTTVILEARQGPQLNNPGANLNACVQNNGFTTFNLYDILEDLLATPDNPNYSISFYLTYSNANNNVNAIANPSNFTNTTAYGQTLYIKVIDNSITNGCPTIAPFDVYTNAVANSLPDEDYYQCDEPDNDGFTEFSIFGIEQYLIGVNDYTVTIYPTLSDLQSGTNAYGSNDVITNTSNPQTLYAHVASSGGCYIDTPVTLVVSPHFSVTPPSAPLVYCSPEVFTNFNVTLHDFDEDLINGNDYTVQYYANQQDALADENEVQLAVNVTNPGTFYARIIDNITHCFDVISFQILVYPAPVTTQPDNIFVCDPDNDGFYIIDLTSVIPQTVSSTTDRSFEFYHSASNAQNSTNMIDNPQSYYTSSTTVYIKVINDITGCYYLRSFQVYISHFNENSTYPSVTLCENDGDGISSLFLVDRDDTILNGETDKEVLYFENMTNAENGTNAIDKYSSYFNISNPQTIFVRVQSIYSASCYKTYSFQLEVKEEPHFTYPQDINMCDDISNDGVEVFDLNSLYNEIVASTSENITVTFHTSLTNAENNVGTISGMYSNVVNPQIIYGRVAGNNECTSIFPMNLNVIKVADFSQPEPYSVCDTNHDGIVYIDLTDEDLGALPERLDNLDIHFYYSESNAQQEVNEIPNPEYVMVNTHTTFYIRIRNVVSDCYLIYPFDVTVNTPPQIVYDAPLKICETSNNQITLSDYNTSITPDYQNCTFTYYGSESNANAGINALSNTYTYSGTSFSLYVKIVNNSTLCSTIGSVSYRMYPVPVAATVADIHACSEVSSMNYDLTVQTPAVLAGNTNTTDLEVSYFYNAADADANTNAIENPSDITITDGQEFFIRVTEIHAGCYDVTSFSTYLFKAPVIPLEEKYVLCKERPVVILDAGTGNNTDTYLWSNGSTLPFLSVSQAGLYHVTATSENNCVSTKYVYVMSSEAAHIASIETTAFTNDNSIVVTVTGSGNYVYSLDGNAPQSSGTFTDVTLGHHTVTVIDQNGCSDTVAGDIVIFGFPKYFTPNGDGINDVWNVFGFEQFTHSEIDVFDRYGKLIKQIRPGSSGWDGTYNGAEMPASDYWFKAYINDVEVPFEHEGHFSLKR